MAEECPIKHCPETHELNRKLGDVNACLNKKMSKAIFWPTIIGTILIVGGIVVKMWAVQENDPIRLELSILKAVNEVKVGMLRNNEAILGLNYNQISMKEAIALAAEGLKTEKHDREETYKAIMRKLDAIELRLPEK